MADYILHSGARFQGCNVLELGAGVGLVSIMAALHAKHIFCTGAVYIFVSFECQVLNRQQPKRWSNLTALLDLNPLHCLIELATCISAVEKALESILESVIFLQILEIKYWISVGVTLKEICQNWMLLEMYL